MLAKIQPDIVTVCCCCGSDEYTSNKDNQFPTQQFINNIAPYTKNVYVTSISLNNETKEFESMNGNIVYSCNQESFSIACSNNQTILKKLKVTLNHHIPYQFYHVPALPYQDFSSVA